MFHFSKHLVTALALLALNACDVEKSADDYLVSANDYFKDLEYKSALIESRNAVKADATNPDGRLLLGELELLVGSAASAEKELKKAIDLGISPADVQSMLSTAYIRQGKFSEALEFDPSSAAQEDQATMYANRSIALFQANRLEEARSDAEVALSIDNTLAIAYLNLARISAVDGDFSQSQTLADLALKNSDEDPSILEFIGDLHSERGNFSAALDSYSRAIKNDPSGGIAAIKRARLNLTLENVDDAEQDIIALSESGIKLPSIKQIEGEIAFLRGDIRLAQQKQEEALAIYSEFLPAISALAAVHLVQGNLEQAEQYGKQLVSDTNSSDHSQRILGAIRFERGDYDLAESSIKPTLNRRSADLFSIRLLVTSYLKQSKYDEAVELMLATINLSNLDSPATIDDIALLEKPSNFLLPDVIKQTSTEEISESQAIVLTNTETLIVNSVIAIDAQQYDKASRYLGELNDLLPNDATVTTLMARVDLLSNNTDKARKSLISLLARDPLNSTATLLLSEIYAQAGDKVRLRKLLQDSLDDGNDDPQISFRLALLDSSLNDGNSLLQWLKEAAETDTNSADAQIILTRYHLNRNNNEDAQQSLDRLGERFSNRIEYLELAAIINIRNGRFKESLGQISILSSRESTNPQWHLLRAKAYAGLGNAQAMHNSLSKALELDPDNLPTLFATARAYSVEGNTKAASDVLAKLTQLLPEDSQQLVNLKQEINRQGTATAIKTSNMDNIRSTEELMEIAGQLWRGGNQEQAINVMKSWLEKYPENNTVRINLANGYLTINRIDEAISLYKQTLSEDPENIMVLNNLAWALSEMAPQQALEYAEKGASIAPENVSMLDTLSTIYLKIPDIESAKRTFATIMTVGTDNRTILLHGAQIYKAAGNTEQALNLLSTILRDSERFAERADAERLYSELKNTRQ